MSVNSTLLGRCTAAYAEAFEVPGSRRTGVAAVLEHLTPHQIITILRLEAAGEIAGWEHESA